MTENISYFRRDYTIDAVYKKRWDYKDQGDVNKSYPAPLNTL